MQSQVLLAQPRDGDGYASIAEMQAWAWYQIEARAPDAIIGDDNPDGAYLRRRWIVPRNACANIYLHQFLRSDDERALHDHPWPNTSLLIQGSYYEHTPDGVFLRQPGDTVTREAEALHRIELVDDEPVISLFITGPKVREWGFACPQGWVHWRDFTAPGNAGHIGKGCAQ